MGRPYGVHGRRERRGRRVATRSTGPACDHAVPRGAACPQPPAARVRQEVGLRRHGAMTTDDSLTTIPADDCTPPPIRTAADLLAALPYQLGFRPEDSVVLTTLCRAPGARTKTLGPLARLDVEGLIDPDAGDALAGAATTRMVGPDAERVLLVCYVPETFGAARLDPDLPTAVTTVDDALPGGGPRVEPSDVWVVAT